MHKVKLKAFSHFFVQKLLVLFLGFWTSLENEQHPKPGLHESVVSWKSM